MAKTRIRRGERVYVYERENYRDSAGNVKHRNTRYLGIEVTINGEKQIIPPKKNALKRLRSQNRYDTVT